MSTGDMTYSSAGHPPGAILQAGGTVDFLSIGDLPLGIVDSVNYTEKEDHLDPGDKLVLYTDGISEARSEAGLFETEGINQLLAGHAAWTAEEITNGLISYATDWAHGKLDDDAAVVVVERRA